MAQIEVLNTEWFTRLYFEFVLDPPVVAHPSEHLFRVLLVGNCSRPSMLLKYHSAGAAGHRYETWSFWDASWFVRIAPKKAQLAGRTAGKANQSGH